MTAPPARPTATPVARDEELFVTCKTCGFLVATGMRVRASELETADLPAHEHRCPRCGAAHAYEKEDYVYGG
jgi:uncharacterized C2H2 Zn-finger protein